MSDRTLRGLASVTGLGVALLVAVGWWFDHCLEMRGIVASFREPSSADSRDTERQVVGERPPSKRERRLRRFAEERSRGAS